MKIKELIEFIRALQRPAVVFLVVGAIVGLAVYLVIKYGDAAMARDIMVFVLGAGGVIIGFLFRDRVKPPAK